MTEARRIWVVTVALMATLLLVVSAIGFWAVPKRREELWFELAKAGIQLAVVIGLGGVVSSVLRAVDASRERRRIRNEHRFATFQQLVAAYHQLKLVRRNLRMVGVRDGPDALRPEQVEALRSGMTMVVEAELTLEQIYREVNTRSVFHRTVEIESSLDLLLPYIRQLVKEWEAHGPAFWPDHQTENVRNLVALQAFLAGAEHGFRKNAADPMMNMQLAVRDELLAGDRS